MKRLHLTSILLFTIAFSGLTACGGGSGTDNVTSSADTQKSSQKQAKQSTRYEAAAAADIMTGSIDVEWVAPVAREDGTPLQLSDIGGYRIYYGVNKGDYANYVDIPDGTVQSITLRDLPAGTYFLAMTTYDVSGQESDLSPSVKKLAA
jgi:hypothetical protein